MRVVHLNHYGAKYGGASIAMFRIIEAQRKAGIDSVVVCRTLSQEKHVCKYEPSVFRRGEEFFSKVAMKLLFGHCYSTGLLVNGMANFVNSLHPDIVQLHWLQLNTVGIRELEKIHAPIVWFTHDLWPMSGVEPYPADEWYKNGAPKGSWINRRAWEVKRDVVSRLEGRLFVVSPSEWARTQTQQSVIFKDTPCTCIHYPVNEILVKACDSFNGEPKSRNDRFTILFGATTGIAALIKGWDRLMSAVDMLADEERSAIRIRVFGCDMPSQKIHGVDVEFLGKLSLEELIPQYRAADLFAFPSRQETWGQTKTEALCCGTPVIAFDQTACAEGIRHQENGWIAPANDIEAYAEGIRWFLQRWKDRKALIVQNEVTDYTPIIIGEQWKCFYQKILSKAS